MLWCNRRSDTRKLSDQGASSYYQSTPSQISGKLHSSTPQSIIAQSTSPVFGVASLKDASAPAKSALYEPNNTQIAFQNHESRVDMYGAVNSDSKSAFPQHTHTHTWLSPRKDSERPNMPAAPYVAPTRNGVPHGHVLDNGMCALVAPPFHEFCVYTYIYIHIHTSDYAFCVLAWTIVTADVVVTAAKVMLCIWLLCMYDATLLCMYDLVEPYTYVYTYTYTYLEQSSIVHI